MHNPMIAAFALGVAVLVLPADKPSAPRPPTSAMKPFVILFRQGPHPLTDADRTQRQAAIGAWARAQNAAGHKLEPRTLGPESAHAAGASSAEMIGAWPVTALLFLEARDFTEATQIAAAHPAKDYNASVEVRPWSPPAVPALAPPALTIASGPVVVKMTPQSAADAAIGRFALDKQFHGELEGTSAGEMLAAMSAVKGSAGYVAIEKVTGKLAGRTGTFCLQHRGIMDRGVPSLAITVVPDSGTGGLTGLTGTMAIKIAADGAHTYEFEYRLPDKA